MGAQYFKRGTFSFIFLYFGQNFFGLKIKPLKFMTGVIALSLFFLLRRH